MPTLELFSKLIIKTLIKNTVKNKQGTTSRMNAGMFNGNNLPHEFLLRA